MNTTPIPACKAIYCIVPNDGTDKRLLVELRKRQGIIRAISATRRGIGVLADVKTKRGKLPQSELVKQVYVLCSQDQADEIFDFIFWFAQLGKPGRGLMWQQALTGCTPYELPAGIPDERLVSATDPERTSNVDQA
ncbi:MAG: hypothetical protein ACR2QV_04280 [Gammaproteobacteria bacterium]